MYANLDVNYLALAVSIIKGWDADKVFDKADNVAHKSYNKYRPEDVLKMAQLRREGMSYEEVGAIFNCDRNTIYVTLKRAGLFEKGLRAKPKGKDVGLPGHQAQKILP